MAEEIDYAADEKLLREKVNIHSPLHVRRTLDQYYFLTLDNTSERDRDQVVYRGTRSLSSTTRVVMVDQLWMWILDDSRYLYRVKAQNTLTSPRHHNHFLSPKMGTE